MHSMIPMKPIRSTRVYVLCLAIVLASLTACSTPTRPQPEEYVTKRFDAPIGKALEVNTGDSVFVTGSYIDGEEIELADRVDLMMPGSLGIPFPVHMAPGKLQLTRIDAEGRYYCATDGQATATFPGLGSVIAQGDCVGIRISRAQGTTEWVVDNSIRNQTTTIWTKRVPAAEVARYQPRPTAKPFKVRVLRRITFDGYHGGQLHFTWDEMTQNSRESKEFTFDFNGGEVPVGIKGNRFRVLHADNIKLTYAWESFEEGA